jgi:class 3 adenylate cyclase
MQAWLRAADNVEIPLTGPMQMGRSASNSIVVPDDKASRQHAVIHPQGDGEFWLIDLGTVNGTYLNERRLVIPARLRPGDTVRIGSTVYTFCQEAVTVVAPSSTVDKNTVPDVQEHDCWLLLADIEGFSMLSHRLRPSELAPLVSAWLIACKKIVDAHDGMINKYTGDGFLAYWVDQGEATAAKVGDALKELMEIQSASPKFRVLAHCTPLAMGGASAAGEESLLGSGVNYLFRAEKVAAALQTSCLLTWAAAERWTDKTALVPLGEHPLKDFPEPKPFYRI